MRWASSIAVAVVIGLTLDSPATPMGVAAGRVALPGVMRLRGGFPGEKFLKKLGGHRNGGEENAAPPAADNTREMSKREMDFIARVQASAKKEEANTEALVATRNRCYLQRSSGFWGRQKKKMPPMGETWRIF
ncbi:hypothetical protein T484DRAFT_1745114 [Baffinella frigidus]|nr:hypothetical protein T484DRAFT_1745114 [Cryptophyta sp. CCMP2293]